MEMYGIFKDLAIIIIFAKVFGILARKCKAPQVVGEIIAGLLIGPSVLGLVQQSDFLLEMAEIGVVLLMFSAGLETDLKELLKTGPVAFLIACAGVFVPLVGGALLYFIFYGFAPWGSDQFYEAVFIGTIMTATSVSITVQSLREMGKLKGKVGTTILSAAIIDDVIGIIVLTFVIGFKNPDSNPGQVIISTVLFFVFAIVVGFLLFKIFKIVVFPVPLFPMIATRSPRLISKFRSWKSVCPGKALERCSTVSTSFPLVMRGYRRIRISERTSVGFSSTSILSSIFSRLSARLMDFSRLKDFSFAMTSS